MSKHSISRVYGREVLDSRGNPTVEVEVELSDHSMGRAIVPSGASTGEHEAIELRDKDPRRYSGLGVQKAISNIHDIIFPAIAGNSFESIRALDEELLEADGTAQKSKLGANALLGVSLAFANALAASTRRPLYIVINENMCRKPEAMKLPVPMMNILNGGCHADNGLEFQEFMVVPHGFEVFSESLRAGTEVFHILKKLLKENKLSTSVGDEGGFAPNLKDNTQALELICTAIEKSNYKLGNQISIALDVASSSFFNSAHSNYRFNSGSSKTATADELLEYYVGLSKKYPILSIEDGLDENDWAGWKRMTDRLGGSVQLVGDDLFVTNKKFVEKGVSEKVANAVLIKVNQIGTLTETFETMNFCDSKKYKTVVSHRSGETEDVCIAHLAVGSGCGQIKTGSLSRGERTGKYNELLRIEDTARRHGTPIALAQPYKS